MEKGLLRLVVPFPDELGIQGLQHSVESGFHRPWPALHPFRSLKDAEAKDHARDDNESLTFRKQGHGVHAIVEECVASRTVVLTCSRLGRLWCVPLDKIREPPRGVNSANRNASANTC